MRKQDPISGTAIAAINPPATTSVLESQVNALKKQFDELAAIHLSETERLKQKIAINDSCNKAEVMHLRLTYQEDMNEKNLEIKSLKNKLRQLLNKTEIR
jgi:hypothetical protein